MNHVLLYFLGLGITLILSFLVVVYINTRYYNVLVDLTEREKRARFWLRYSNILLFLVPLVFSMTIYPNSMFEITSQVKWGIVGLILSLLALGVIMVIYITYIGKK